MSERSAGQRQETPPPPGRARGWLGLRVDPGHTGARPAGRGACARAVMASDLGSCTVLQMLTKP